MYIDLTRLYLYDKTKACFLLPLKLHPLRSSIRLTERCNSRCITCDYWKKDWQDKISTEKAVDFITQLYKLGIKRLRFTGGEPLLRNDFFEILNQIKHLGFKKITIATNGFLLATYAEQINNSCLTDIGVSIDGLAENNDKIRGISGGFDRVMASLDLIKDKRITIMTTLTSWLSEDLQGLFEVIKRKNILWDFNLPDSTPYFLQNTEIEDCWPNENQVNKILSLIKQNINEDYLQRISKQQLDFAEKYLRKQKLNEPPCYLGYTNLDVDSAGNVYSGCYVMPPIGNILESNLDQIITTSEYKKRLQDMLSRKCLGCHCGYEMNLIISKLPQRFLEHITGKGKK